MFFILKNYRILTKVIFFFLKKNVKNKGNVDYDIFLDVADVSSYLTFKLSSRQGDYKVSFELQMPQTSSTPFWKALTEFYQVK